MLQTTSKEAIDAYKSILMDLKSAYNDNKLSLEERERLENRMLEVADRIAERDDANKEWVNSLVKSGVSVFVFVVGVGATLLGVSSGTIKTPNIKIRK